MTGSEDLINEAFEKMAGSGGTWHLRRCLDDNHEGSRRYLTLDPNKERLSCEECEKKNGPYNPPSPRGAA
jgi:hypothetical protein